MNRCQRILWAYLAGLLVMGFSLSASALEVTKITLSGRAPAGTTSVTVDGSSFPVAADGTFTAEIDVSANDMALDLQSDAATTRQVDIAVADVGPPIAGLGVSVEELQSFLGGKSGVLAWVDAGKRMQMLDFRSSSPQVEPLGDHLDCINPRISPDGTRVVYSRGPANRSKEIFVRSLSGGPSERIASGDIGYWAVDSNGDESIVYCDWSDKTENGADGKTYRQPLVTGDIALNGTAEEIHDRAMDGGPNGSMTWLGQVYNELWAYNLDTSTDYPTDKFFLQDGTPADHQTCNGSMAPDSSGQLMVLVIPHDWIRIFSYQSSGDQFEETSRFNLPSGFVEWEFPEWSTDPDYLTAILRASDLKNRLFVVKVGEGELIPDVLEISDEEGGASYSHLYVAP